MTILGIHKSEGYSLFSEQLFYRKSSDKTSRSAVIPAFYISTRHLANGKTSTQNADSKKHTQ